MIFRGKLRPKNIVDEMRQDAEARVLVYKDLSETWQKAYHTSEAARQKQETALQECLELSRTSAKILESLHEVTGK